MADISFDDSGDSINLALSIDCQPMIKMNLQKCRLSFVSRLIHMACGLMRAFGAMPLLKLLCTPTVRIALKMPKTAAQSSRVPQDYTGGLHKGRSPLAINAWPACEEDRVEFGSHKLPSDKTPEQNG